MPHIPYQPRPVSRKPVSGAPVSPPPAKPPEPPRIAPGVSQPISRELLDLPDIPDLPFDDVEPLRPDKPQVDNITTPRKRTYNKAPGLDSISMHKHTVDPGDIAKKLGLS